jgi:WhiB family redox-sensing transcriptional regulator
VAALAELLDAIAAAPNLAGAACVSHVDLFDATVARGRAGQLHAQAIAVCAGCPALAQCADWISHLPAGQRPYGVIAGRYWSQRGDRAA